MSEFSGDQVHPASPARREQARRDGDHAKSHELAAAVQMIGAVGVAYLTFGPLAGLAATVDNGNLVTISGV